MDNIKTGTLIKDLRKEKGMTQKDLADQLHITDRAVSKWERGLCAPDISTLEPLAKILGITITELISGQRMDTWENVKEIEESVQDVIVYSEKEISAKTCLFRKKYLIGFGVFIVNAIVICMTFLWLGGFFNIAGRSISPNEEIQLTIFNRAAEQRFPRRPTITVRSQGAEVSTVVYYGSYQGVYWSPDSSMYILSFYNTDGTTQLILNSIEGSNSSNLNAYLSFGVEMNELSKYGLQYSNQSPLPNVQYQFLQWSLDSKFILIYYSFTDVDKKIHEGYFWYDCRDGSIKSTLELQPLSI